MGSLAIFVRPSTIAATSFPNAAFDVGERQLGVFDDVVQQPAGDGHGIELEVGEDLRDLDGVRDVRLAGVAALSAVRRFAELIGAQQQVAIELVVQGQLVFAPTRNQLTYRRRRHNSPASAKLVYRPRPMITWSCTGMSSNRPAATNCSVTASIVRRRRRVAARMIVHEDDCRRSLGDRLAKDFARMHERGVEDPASDRDVALEPMLRVEHGNVELFDRQIFHAGTEVFDDISRRPHRSPILPSFSRHAASELERRVNRHRPSESYARTPR